MYDTIIGLSSLAILIVLIMVAELRHPALDSWVARLALGVGMFGFFVLAGTHLTKGESDAAEAASFFCIAILAVSGVAYLYRSQPG